MPDNKNEQKELKLNFAWGDILFYKYLYRDTYS